jgi:hypothetical protein
VIVSQLGAPVCLQACLARRYSDCKERFLQCFVEHKKQYAHDTLTFLRVHTVRVQCTCNVCFFFFSFFFFFFFLKVSNFFVYFRTYALDFTLLATQRASSCWPLQAQHACVTLRAYTLAGGVLQARQVGDCDAVCGQCGWCELCAAMHIAALFLLAATRRYEL